MIRKEVIVIGNIIYDSVLLIDSQIKEGTKIVSPQKKNFVGGQAANVAQTLAGLGVPVSFMGAFGADNIGELMFSALQKKGIRLEQSKIVKNCQSAEATIAVDKNNGERTILICKPHRLHLSSSHFRKLKQNSMNLSDIVYSDGHEIDVAFYKKLKRLNKIIVCDVEIITPGLFEILGTIDYLIISEPVLKEMSGQSSTEEAFNKLTHLGAKSIIVTNGEGMSKAWHKNKWYSQKAVPTSVIDTTGAGDAFRAGFIWSLLRNFSFKKCLRYASFLGSVNCSFLGPTIPYKNLKLLKKTLL